MSARVSGNTLSGGKATKRPGHAARVLGDTAQGIGGCTRLGKDYPALRLSPLRLDPLCINT